jgi:hypothetical protein
MRTGRPTHACVDRIAHSRVTVSEKGKTVTFKNPHNLTFEKVRVDGCLVTEGARADWIVTKVGVASAVVELKGRDVAHAIDQLFATVDNQKCKELLERPVKLLVVCAKYPSFDTMVARAQIRARKLGMSLKVVCRTFDCEIEQL